MAAAICSERPAAEFEVRFELLRNAVDHRFSDPVACAIDAFCDSLFSNPEPTDVIPGLYAKPIRALCAISLQTWRAQEVVMGDGDDATVAAAAREAQRCNACRTALIRDIDALLGESNITITTKTYG